jgi:hypothetical protein
VNRLPISAVVEVAMPAPANPTSSRVDSMVTPSSTIIPADPATA